MASGDNWFEPKRFGYGSGLPISKEGWLLMIGYVAGVAACLIALQQRPIAAAAMIVALTAAFAAIAARKTRGGWRWRWGERD